MNLKFWAAAAIISLGLIEASCTPAAPDIRVFRRGQILVIDFPWSAWRLIGLQDRNLCLRHIQVFDTKSVVWRADVPGGEDPPCVNIEVPIPMGFPLEGFVSGVPLRLHAGRTYGVVLDDLTEVNFVPFTEKPPQNIVDFRQFIQAPCETGWNGQCRGPR